MVDPYKIWWIFKRPATPRNGSNRLGSNWEIDALRVFISVLRLLRHIAAQLKILSWTWWIDWDHNNWHKLHRWQACLFDVHLLGKYLRYKSTLSNCELRSRETLEFEWSWWNLMHFRHVQTIKSHQSHHQLLGVYPNSPNTFSGSMSQQCVCVDFVMAHLDWSKSTDAIHLGGSKPVRSKAFESIRRHKALKNI